MLPEISVNNDGSKDKSPLLVIVGQTASGKSSLALTLAQQLNGELICADSWTVRREVNIGTAKPSVKERQLVPHHLLDVVEPDGDFTAAVFKELANKAIADITSRGKLPILVGGTGLYIDGVIFDFGFLAAGDRSLRPVLNDLKIPELIKIIEAQGILFEGIDIRNKRRLIRLLETNGQRPTRHDLRSNTLIVGIDIDMSDLDNRIAMRVNHMFEQGLEDEVRQLSEHYGWDCEALKGIGYREWQTYFDGQQSIEETRQQIVKATHDLAKRQRTWFKRNKSIQWIKTPVNVEHVVDLVTTSLNK
jgi:tRNA dimethylallyltransferase